MKNKIVITGGAGFIGSNLISKLNPNDWDIVVIDSLLKQVHENRCWSPPNHVKFIHSDICNKLSLKEVFKDTNFLIHLAAETGVGQSAYEIARHVKTNELGTAIVLEEAAKNKDSLRGIILASSRAVYGEGIYQCNTCKIEFPGIRTSDFLKNNKWEPTCQKCQKKAMYLESKEDHPLIPSSIYGITKLNQEHLLKQFSSMFSIPSIALRFQNVYGPGQSLINPYTGILAVFSTRARSGNPILVYEDGEESRDFVYIDDVVNSIKLCLEKGFKQEYDVFNVGSGNPATVYQVAKILTGKLQVDVPIVISGKYRVGDIRHSCANITKISKALGYSPGTTIDKGLELFANWVKKQPLIKDRFTITEKKLREKGLLVETKNHLQ